jgi:hypothetical protein
MSSTTSMVASMHSNHQEDYDNSIKIKATQPMQQGHTVYNSTILHGNKTNIIKNKQPNYNNTQLHIHTAMT